MLMLYLDLMMKRNIIEYLPPLDVNSIRKRQRLQVGPNNETKLWMVYRTSTGTSTGDSKAYCVSTQKFAQQYM